MFFLQSQNMTRFDAVNYLSHGITKITDEDGEAVSTPSGTDEDVAEGRSNKKGAGGVGGLLRRSQQKSREG